MHVKEWIIRIVIVIIQFFGVPLHYAAMGGNDSIVEELLKHHADISLQDRVSIHCFQHDYLTNLLHNIEQLWKNPLHYAVQYHHLRSAELILQHDAHLIAVDRANHPIRYTNRRLTYESVVNIPDGVSPSNYTTITFLLLIFACLSLVQLHSIACCSTTWRL